MTKPRNNHLKSGDNDVKHSFWSLPAAVTLVVAGILCTIAPFVSRVSGPSFIGRVLIFCGIVHLFKMFSAQGARLVIKRSPRVVIPLSIGALVLLNEGPHARSLAVLLIIFFVIDGCFNVMLSIDAHPTIISSPTSVSAGLSFIFAVFVAVTLPATPVWLLEVVLGLNLISMGVMIFLEDTQR